MKKPDGNWLLMLLKGALIGTGGILPGISGGVLSVALGVYKPVMALLAHPIRELRARFWYYLPLAVGFALGVLGLSRVVAWMFSASEVAAVWLFIGLIAGTFPSLWKEAGAQGRPASGLVCGGVAFAVALTGFLLLQSAGTAQVTPNVWVWLLCGVLWGVGLIAPGMSSSSLFILMGVYEPMATGIADLSLPVLLPMGAGLAASVLTLSHGVNALLRRFYAQTMHAIMGVAMASTVAIIPISSLTSWRGTLLYAFCFAVGLIAALWMGRLGGRQEAAKEE